MKIAISSDHGGYNLKQTVMKHLDELKIEYKDFGCSCCGSVDYPDFALPVAESITAGEYTMGIIICGTGIGISIAANKVPGIRAAVCNDSFTARLSREHNDANILALGERVLGPGIALNIVDEFLKGEFQGGRHAVRVAKIKEIEGKYSKNK
ncbi:putative sugar phosphate isomerase YwlF [Oxobacter pfennigii]|uniref:Putative sugar phosphate isomerase YwlF n=1 Tax=Oxobacter pfennigii TaxID=36849 RepID=A0A0P8WA74_9CLOT|nr:ribose 5-phosphate isomerase B [Oxobacter pfennigii]KPU44617.1 putative sugar phosphate isomerase YwlF [Oxobacter pfennigii]